LGERKALRVMPRFSRLGRVGEGSPEIRIQGSR